MDHSDARLINQPNPTLWTAWSEKQVFVTALERASPGTRPGHIPDEPSPRSRSLQRSFGGRVYPLWADAQATQSNVRAQVLQAMAEAHGAAVGPEDFIAYIATVMAHPAFTARFCDDLVAAGPARAANCGQGAFRRGRRARARSDLAALLRRAFVTPTAGRRKVRRACRRERRLSFPPTAPFPARPSPSPTP